MMSLFDILCFIGLNCGCPGLLLSTRLSRCTLTDYRVYANLKGIVELQFWSLYGVNILDADTLLPQENRTPWMSWEYFIPFYIFPVAFVTLPVCKDTQTQQGLSSAGLQGPWGRSKGGIDTSYLENMSCAPPRGTKQYKFKHFTYKSNAVSDTIIQTKQSPLTLLWYFCHWLQ